MNINETIYIISPVELYGKFVPNSAQILKAKVIEILKDKLTVEIDLGEGRIQIKTVTEPYYKTFHDALPHMETFINNKVKVLNENEYKGEDIPSDGSNRYLTEV